MNLRSCRSLCHQTMTRTHPEYKNARNAMPIGLDDTDFRIPTSNDNSYVTGGTFLVKYMENM